MNEPELTRSSRARTPSSSAAEAAPGDPDRRPGGPAPRLMPWGVVARTSARRAAPRGGDVHPRRVRRRRPDPRHHRGRRSWRAARRPRDVARGARRRRLPRRDHRPDGRGRRAPRARPRRRLPRRVRRVRASRRRDPVDAGTASQNGPGPISAGSPSSSGAPTRARSSSTSDRRRYPVTDPQPTPRPSPGHRGGRPRHRRRRHPGARRRRPGARRVRSSPLLERAGVVRGAVPARHGRGRRAPPGPRRRGHGRRPVDRPARAG